MESFRTKTRWTLSYKGKILWELAKDLWTYYITPYPFLLIIGAYRRMVRRFKIIIWTPKGRGRPPNDENIVDLILEMKRCNKIWSAQRISDELRLMGIRVSKKSILKILRVNGFSPPRTKFAHHRGGSVLSSFSRYWSMDFTCVFDMGGLQIFIFAIIEVLSRRLILINATTKPTKEWLIQ